MQKRILAIHDISCYGRCSLTVALPILSMMGCECTILPTAVLSTHTGGFSGYTFTDLTYDMIKIAEHWKKEGISFDGIYTGYLGSGEQLDIVTNIIDMFDTPDMKVIIDPVMGDNGELYAGFDEAFAKGMAKLCSKADVIIPNLTEAVYMTSGQYTSLPFTERYVDGVLDNLMSLGCKNAVLTGVAFNNGTLGASVRCDGKTEHFIEERIEGMYHGTGDVFGSALVGAYLNEKTLFEATQIAVKYTQQTIRQKFNDKSDFRNGVPFESCTEYLLQLLK